MTIDCINLTDLFGDLYKIAFDPSYSPHNVAESTLDPWYMQIPCLMSAALTKRDKSARCPGPGRAGSMAGWPIL